MEGSTDFMRNQLDNFAKELLLRVNIKDLCHLLD